MRRRASAHTGVVQLAPRVFLHDPEVSPRDLPEGSIALAQLASSVFGDGSHPTTRLCARAVDLLCRQRRPRAVLDVGTGTGVLARLARAHGARFVVGTDIDPDALDIATRNAAFDDHPEPLVVDARAPDTWGPRFDLVVANILEAPLLSLAPALSAALAPGGALLLSGFTPVQAPALRARFEADGLVFTTQAQDSGWSLLQLERSLSA